MVTQAEYELYREKNLTIVKDLLASIGTRPVLFLGSGITRRYLGAPSWQELLLAIAHQIGMLPDQFNFVSQKASNEPSEIGTLLIDIVHEWAWSSGKAEFPEAYFTAETDKSVFLKHLAAR